MEKINKLDIFGISPQFFIDNKHKYQTRFGTFLSAVLFAIICAAAYIYGNDVYFRQNPQSIFTEGSTQHPELFQINKTSMNFAFGLQTENYDHYVDPSVYTVQIDLHRTVSKKLENGDVTFEKEVIDLRGRLCKKEDFGIAVDYFHKLPFLEKLYCIDNWEEAQMEGDYGADVFTDVEAKFYPCKNSTLNGNICRNKTDIDDILKNNYWAIYTSDTVVNAKKYEEPFTPVGRGNYGVSSGSIFKHIDFYYRNIYIEDNTGVVFDHWNSKRGLQYSLEKEFISMEPADNDKFLQLVFRLEKVKFTTIYRTYLNLAQVIANVGGIMKVAMLVLFVFSTYVTSVYYDINMANHVFNFKYEYNGSESSKGGQACQKKELSLPSIWQILFPRCQKKHIKTQRELLDFSVQKLGYHLNIKNILHKMMEIDKLKRVLLDQDQLQLFEFLPKPVIDESIVEKHPQDTQDKEEENKKKKSDVFKLDFKKSRSKILSEFDILFEDRRSSIQKEMDAYQAYLNIGDKSKKMHIDRKILQLINYNWIKSCQKKIDEEKQKRKNKEGGVDSSGDEHDINMAVSSNFEEYKSPKKQFGQYQNKLNLKHMGNQQEIKISVQKTSGFTSQNVRFCEDTTMCKDIQPVDNTLNQINSLHPNHRFSGDILENDLFGSSFIVNQEWEESPNHSAFRFQSERQEPSFDQNQNSSIVGQLHLPESKNKNILKKNLKSSTLVHLNNNNNEFKNTLPLYNNRHKSDSALIKDIHFNSHFDSSRQSLQKQNS